MSVSVSTSTATATSLVLTRQPAHQGLTMSQGTILSMSHPRSALYVYVRDRPSSVRRADDRPTRALFSFHAPAAFPPGCLACFARLSPCTTPPPEPLLVLAIVPRAFPSLSPALAALVLIVGLGTPSEKA